MAKHYSVRKSVQFEGKFKIVLAGGYWGYEDIDLPMFDTIDAAMVVAERLEKLRREAA